MFVMQEFLIAHFYIIMFMIGNAAGLILFILLIAILLQRLWFIKIIKPYIQFSIYIWQLHYTNLIRLSIRQLT